MSKRIWSVIVEVRMSVQDGDPLAARQYAEKYVAKEGFTVNGSFIDPVSFGKTAIGGQDG